MEIIQEIALLCAAAVVKAILPIVKRKFVVMAQCQTTKPNRYPYRPSPSLNFTSFTSLIPRLLCPETRVRAWERSYLPLPLLRSQWQQKAQPRRYRVCVCVCVYECCNVHSLTQTWPKHSMRVVEPSNSLGNAVVLPARHRCQNWTRIVSRLRIMAATVHIPCGSGESKT